jgi:hypothetical protein
MDVLLASTVHARVLEVRVCIQKKSVCPSYCSFDKDDVMTALQSTFVANLHCRCHLQRQCRYEQQRLQHGVTWSIDPENHE